MYLPFHYYQKLFLIYLFLFFNIGIVFFSFWVGLFLAYFIQKFLNKSISHDLYRIGIFSFISLLLHNIPEGILSFITASYDIRLGLSIIIAIMFHNIPEGILISIPVFYEFNDWKRAFLLSLIAGFSEFFVSIIACLFLNSISYKNEFFILSSFLFGVLIMILCFILL